MERGLLWMPLLITICWLTWAGWNEYRKVEAYRAWAEKFDQAKYDILAVLGQKGADLSWGKPTRQGIINLQTFSLHNVETISLYLDEKLADWQNLPHKIKGNPRLEFSFRDDTPSQKIPFTDCDLAVRWGQYLQRLQSEISKK